MGFPGIRHQMQYPLHKVIKKQTIKRLYLGVACRVTFGHGPHCKWDLVAVTQEEEACQPMLIRVTKGGESGEV